MSVPTTTPTARRSPYTCRGRGPMLRVPFNGLGMNASGENGIGGDARTLNKARGCADTGGVTTPRLLRLAPIVAMLLIAAACTLDRWGRSPAWPATDRGSERATERLPGVPRRQRVEHRHLDGAAARGLGPDREPGPPRRARVPPRRFWWRRHLRDPVRHGAGQ